MKRVPLFIFLLLLAALDKAAACQTRLWHDKEVFLLTAGEAKESNGVKERLLLAAEGAMRERPAPVVTLHSAGVRDISDAELILTRRGFRDADNFAILSLAYALTGQDKYLQSARETLLAWAKANKPTGNPIDETRLEGFLWGYDLLNCRLTKEESQAVDNWFRSILAAKRAWAFGPKTEHNNHKTHHLKMVLMLDKLLGLTRDYGEDLDATVEHAKINLPYADGSSLDFHERDALYYHVYDLEAWIEIALVTDCCIGEIDRAFAFLRRALLSDRPRLEFQKSTAEIDRQRAQGGFSYVQQGKVYDADGAARAIFSYYTLRPQLFYSAMWGIATRSKRLSSVLFYQYRYFLWQNR